CGANEKGQKIFSRHIWQAHLDLAEQLRKTERGKKIYAMRKETIERVFGDAKEKHAMRYTTYRGLARVTNWVRLKFAAMNLKKLAMWMCKTSASIRFSALFSTFSRRTAVFVG
ncbi:MAG: transposase, partial [Oscillibacter sp.]